MGSTKLDMLKSMRGRLGGDLHEPDVPDADFAKATNYFGIKEERQSHGNKRWTIEIASDVPGSLPQRVWFDEGAKCWRTSGVISALDAGLESGATGKVQRTPSEVTNHAQQNDRPVAHAWDLKCDQWTRGLPATGHSEFFRSIDWASTPLGHVATWPHALRLYTHLALTEKRASVLYWGPENIAIYNEQFVELIGSNHPAFMGSSFQVVWPEIWDSFRPLFHELKTSLSGITLDKYCLFLERHDYLEETWWVGDLFALKDDDGSYGGAYFSWHEISRQEIRDRRTQLLNDIGKPKTHDPDTVWQHIHDVLSSNPRDVSMGILYTAEDSDGDYCKLERKHTIGVNTGDEAAPKELDLNGEAAKQGFGPALRQARRSQDDFILLDTHDANFDKKTIEDVDWQGYGHPSRYVVVVPLPVMNLVKGFVIMGLNPRRDFDADHQQYVGDLARQLRSLMATITTTAQARQREADLMKELAESEKRIRRMAEMAPVGMYDLATDGSLIWANNHFFEMMGIASDKKDASTFVLTDYIKDEDQAQAHAKFVQCFTEKVEISDTIRLKRGWNPPLSPSGDDHVEEPTWILFQAYPHAEDNGEVSSLMGCITDISHLKWAAQVQARTAEAAKTAKQRQEEFIDITSHEMRNPLSAITQCADGIISSRREAEAAAASADVSALLEVLKSSVEAAESILLCASHQRRIIDDVLTLSKLDSALLHISPAPFRPSTIVHEAMQMFHAEFESESNDIQVQTMFDEPSTLGNQDIVYCDPSRLMQVLVNLLTNAIKFTRTEETRRIIVRSGAGSCIPPAEMFGENFRWSPNKPRPDLTEDVEYGQGAPIYLYWAVSDTGQGLPKDSASEVFNKFQQASRRTHIKYGGSGLGLFISRELTEMQGGMIGVGSEVGKGSTFAFYVKAKRATTPSLTLLPKNSSHKRAGSISTTPAQSPTRQTAPSASPQAKKQKALSRPVTPTREKVNFNCLLVEDNLLNQKILAKQLRKAGCTVAVANHGQEAVDYLLKLYEGYQQNDQIQPNPQPLKLDCVLMDWEMPVMDGLTATRNIRELEQQGKLQGHHMVLGVTANARLEQIALARQAGMDEVVPKPFTVPELLAKINELKNEVD